MKKIIFASLITILLSSCATSKRTYVFKLTQPNKSENLKYSDEFIDIMFDIRESDISFKYKNTSKAAQKIIWDEASFVNNGEAQKVIHKNIKFIDKEKNQAATVVPPGAFISDLIQPIDDIKFNRSTIGRTSYSYWSSKPIFQTIGKNPNYPIDKTEKNKYKKFIGAKLNFYLPIVQGDIKKDYYFEFEVVDVVMMKNNKIEKSLVYKNKK
jgi:hypothetical protein